MFPTYSRRLLSVTELIKCVARTDFSPFPKIIRPYSVWTFPRLKFVILITLVSSSELLSALVSLSLLLSASVFFSLLGSGLVSARRRMRFARMKEVDCFASMALPSKGHLLLSSRVHLCLRRVESGLRTQYNYKSTYWGQLGKNLTSVHPKMVPLNENSPILLERNLVDTLGSTSLN